MFYKMFRSYYISLFYLSTKKYKEAVGFIFKVEIYVKQVEQDLKSLKNKSDLNLNELEKFVKDLTSEINQSKYKIQSAAILESNEISSLSDQNTDLTKEQLEKIVILLIFLFI